MHWIDYTIIGALVVGLLLLLFVCNRNLRCTADFLVANRCARRYLLVIAAAISGIGTSSIISQFEQTYESGFAPCFWRFMTAAFGVILGICGWISYRYRETRCMTMAQFFEVRYSRRFRIFAGFISWISGIVNYGIFPAVSIRFFMVFCRIPEKFSLGPIQVDAFALLMIVALSLGVLFAISGGQISIIVTDMVQGVFCNAVFILIMIVMICKFNWSDLVQPMAARAAADGQCSMFNPFKTMHIKDFNFVFFLMSFVYSFLCSATWQGSAGYSGAAKTAHEGKMAGFLGQWRNMLQGALFLVIPLCAFAFFSNPKFAALSAPAAAELAAIGDPQLQVQARVPIFLAHILPIGASGMVVAMMFAAMLSTDNTYMHSWGSIFIQDVVLPLRGKPISNKAHIWLLRGSIVFVAVFAFLFSYFFRQTEFIWLFMIISGALFMCGAGIVLIGGLYSKRGTTWGAWGSQITGSVLITSGMLIQQCWDRGVSKFLYDHFRWEWVGNHMKSFPLNSMEMAFYVCMLCVVVYFSLSALERKIKKLPYFDLNKMLHRDENSVLGRKMEWSFSGILARVGLTTEFTRSDRVIFAATFLWTFGWFVMFLVFTAGETLFGGISDAGWLGFWKVFTILNVCIGMVVTVWLSFGSISDTFKMFGDLRELKVNYEDDGSVHDHKNAGEE